MVIAPNHKPKRPPRAKRQVLPGCWFRRIQAARILRRCDGKLTELNDRQLVILLHALLVSGAFEEW